MPIASNRPEESQLLHSEQQRLQRQCQQLRMSVIMTFFLAMIIAMPFPVALLLLFLIWIQESIWRADITRIAARLKKIESNAPDLPSLAQWKAEAMNPPLIINEAKQPRVLFLYMLLFGVEMTVFGMGMWPT